MQDGQGPIKWFIAESPGRSEAVIVNNPSLALSIQVTDKDVTAQAFMSHRVVQSHRNSLRIDTRALQEHIPQGQRVWQAVTQRHFAGDTRIGGDHLRIFKDVGIKRKGRKDQ